MPEPHLPSNAYAGAFVPGNPRNSVEAIQTRIRKAKQFNEELADYFAARRELEETYLKQLQKVSKRSFLSDPSSIPPGYAPVYERLIQELAEVASAHAELEKRIAEDCEAPLRNTTSKVEWDRLQTHDEWLTLYMRELNSLEMQLQKDEKKLEGASQKKASQANAKVQETEKSIELRMFLWEREAPAAFHGYQRIDNQRLELLKETVAKFETAQSDAAQRIMSSSEKTMQECLTFDTQADMQDFMLKNGSAAHPRNARTATSRPAPAPAAPGLNRQPSIASRSISSRNGPDASARGQANGAGAGMGEFGASSTSLHSADRTMSSSQDAATPSKSGGSTLKNAFSRFGRGRSKKDSANTQTMYGGLPEEPNDDSSFSSINRSGTLRQNSAAPTGGSSSRNAALLSAADDSIDSMAPGSGGGLMAPLTPSTAAARKNSANVPATGSSSGVAPTSDLASTSGSAPLVDSEGYSIPPPDRKPWETAAIGGVAGVPGGAAAGSSLMDDNDDSRDTFDNSINSRVSNMNISSQPISEDASKDKAALERMKSTLLTSGPPSRRTTTRRDRRDVRNTTYNPAFTGVGSGDDSRLSQFGTLSASPQTSTPTSPWPFGAQSAYTGVAGVGRHRTQSIASVASSTNPFENSSSSSPIKASLSERVNVIFVGKEVSKVMVVGELSVAVAANLGAGAVGKPLHIRIEAFEQLEKAAPNPAFLKAVPGGTTPGEYLLDIKLLQEQGVRSGLPASGAQAVVLKYQLHVSESRKEEYVPLSLHAQWRCEPHQTSFLMTYSPSSICKFSGEGPAVLQDLQVAVQIQPSNVSNIMSKPTAMFVAETKSLFWKVNENLSLLGMGAEVNKLLARCQIEGAQTVPSPVYLKWRILGKTISSLGITTVGEGAAEGGAKIEEVVRQCTAGKFIASP